jgi:molecular chaperone GrpE
MDNNRKLATVSLIQKLLPVLDALDQAMANEKNPEQDKSGMQQIMKLFSNVLTKEGLEEIEAAGTIFNPEFHEAISQEEVEELSEETVLEVFRRGYRIGDRVIRASMVKVGVPTAEPVIEPTEEIVEVNSPESEEE